MDPIIITSNTDIQLFYLINIQMQNSFFDIIMPFISQIGYFSFWLVISLIMFLFGGEKGKKVALLSFTALFIGFFVTEILKYMVHRPRPFEVLEGVRILAPIDGYSWPSGHSVASFTVATVIGREYGFVYFFIFAILVAFSRVYNGVHYPSDVISGALIGILIGLLVVKYDKNILRSYKNIINHLKLK